METLLKESQTEKNDKHGKFQKHSSRHKRRELFKDPPLNIILIQSSSNSQHRSHHSHPSKHRQVKPQSRSRSKEIKENKEKKISSFTTVPSDQTQNDMMQEKLKQMEKERQKQIERELDQAKRDDQTVIVLQLPQKISEKEIYKFFSDGQCGKIKDIRIIRDSKTNRAKGIGYVEFYNQDSVQRACAMTGKTLGGNSLQIQQSSDEIQKMHGFTMNKGTIQSHIQGPSGKINEFDEESGFKLYNQLILGNNFIHNSERRAALMLNLTRQQLTIKPDQFTQLQMQSMQSPYF